MFTSKKAPVAALLRWLLLYPFIAGAICFAIGAASVTGGQVAAAVVSVLVGAVVGWEAARENCDDRTCAGWAALAVTLALLLCLVGVAAARETIYCDHRNCTPLFD